MGRPPTPSDLLRDDRILVHSITTTREGNEGEVKVRGRAIPIDDPATRAHYRDEVAVLGWQPEEPYTIGGHWRYRWADVSAWLERTVP
jgi:hypothetical protein